MPNYCYDCGTQANIATCLKRYGKPPKKLTHEVSTYHEGKCAICGKTKPVTEARDFFYPSVDDKIDI